MANHQLSLLLIISDKTTASITDFRLRLLGYDVTLIERGEQIASALNQRRPDLAIVELALSGLSGFETISRLRREVDSGLPIIALSPDSSPESVRQAYMAGSDEYLLMPFDPATMEQKIELMISDAQTRPTVMVKGA